VIAAVFYIAAAAVGMSMIESGTQLLFTEGGLFGGYDFLVFGGYSSQRESQADVEYNDLTEEAEEAASEEVIPSESAPSEEDVEATSEAVTEDTPEEESGEEKYYSFTVITSGFKNLNMRAEATTESKIIGTIPHGVTGYVLEVGDEWSKVSYNGKEGYCSNEFINLKEISKEEFEEGTRENEPG